MRIEIMKSYQSASERGELLLDHVIITLFAEWNNKAAAFVSYGGAGGARAVQPLRLAIQEEGKIHESIRIPESSGGDWMDLKCA